MDAMLFGLNLLLIYAGWRWVWRKTALDMHRDELFDLRDEVKDYFNEHGLGTEHPIYEALRGLINAHIRYTEKLTFRLFMAESNVINTHPERIKKLKAEVNARFATNDPELKKFIEQTRARSIAILNAHMVESSFGFLLLTPLIFIVVSLIKLFLFLKAIARNQNTQRIIANAKHALKLAPLAGLILAMPARAGIFHPCINSNIVEEYSYQAAHRP